MNKIALITGISGQDGSYLAKLLLNKGYKVIGLIRDTHKFNFEKLDFLNIKNDVIIEEVSLLDYKELYKLFEKYKPSKVFNFASQSSVGLSYTKPKETLDFNIQSVINLLECIRIFDKNINFFQASSSEIFGNIDVLPVNEKTSLNPMNIYAVSKATGQNMINNYRKIFDLNISTAIFFNHESILRGDNFVIKKIIRDLVKIKNKKLDKLIVGNINIKRDFGYAPKYMEAVYKMCSLSKGDDFILSSGMSLSIKEIIYYIIKKLNLDRSVIIEDKSLFRINDIEDIYGDNSKARKTLDWSYDIDFFKVLDELLEYEENKQKIGYDFE